MVGQTIDVEIPQSGAVTSLDDALQGISGVGEFVGQGAQGQVYRLRDVYQGRDVAVKVLRYRSGQEDIAQVAREVELLRGRDLPGIVRYYGYNTEVVEGIFGTVDVLVKIYTDFVSGKSLENAGNLSATEIEQIYFSLLERTAALHSENIIHRDLKPSNIMRTNDGEIVVIDLGIAKPLNQPTLTATKGAFVGSYNYTAPEIREGKKHSPASDLYSLAPLVLELARGAAYEGVIDRSDLVSNLAAAKNITPVVRQGLEALLTADPQERMKRFALVIEDGKKMYSWREVATVVPEKKVVSQKTAAEKKEKSLRLQSIAKSIAGSTAKYTALASLSYVIPAIGLPLLGGIAAYEILRKMTHDHDLRDFVTFIGAAAGLATGIGIHVINPTYDETPTATDDPSIQVILDSTASAHIFPFIAKDSHEVDGFFVDVDGSRCYFNVDGDVPQSFNDSWKNAVAKRLGVLVVEDPGAVDLGEKARESLAHVEHSAWDTALFTTKAEVKKAAIVQLQKYIAEHPEMVEDVVSEKGAR